MHHFVVAIVEGDSDVTNNTDDKGVGAASLQPGTMSAMNGDKDNDIVAPNTMTARLPACSPVNSPSLPRATPRTTATHLQCRT
jgi:hypothetical protein